MRSGLTVSCALTLAVGLLATGAAGAPQTRMHTNVSAAEQAIKSAIRYEDAAIGDSERKAWHAAGATLGAQEASGLASLRYANDDVSAATKDGEIDAATEGRIDSHLSDAEALDRKGENAAHHEDPNSVKHWVTLARAHKEKALSILEAVTPPNTNALTSPAGSGAIKVTNIKCYANGTGTNPERDADFTVGGAQWHIQQVYPASYVPGGSAVKPVVFIEDKPAPYNEPDIHIYAAFGVTVSGDITAVGSGQQVTVNSDLVTPTGAVVTPSGHITLSYKCP